MNKKIVIAWWSGGITSAVACYWALKTFKHVELVMLDTKGNEDDDTYRFLKDCETLYAQKIKIISNKNYERIEDVWDEYLNFAVAGGAICSTVLKREVREDYQDLSKHWGQVFGFEHDKAQIKRHFRMRRNYPEINVISPLIDMKWNKEESKAFFRKKKIKIPRAYDWGFENNNCLKTGCSRGGIGYWMKRKRKFPDSFNHMADKEHKYTNIKGEPVTICKDQSGKKKGYVPVFLKPHPDYPNVKDISMIKGIQPKPIMECFGFCSTQYS
ncbi:phosphoadenosine phosphosulfate reductase family protein [Candidatus Pacearchaeota archaeon]|nr:phosphoadenosine phosphosulfate reductase family protein [Candidatus Pacearchaeota archaeon]